jgi:hypothetical protein
MIKKRIGIPPPKARENFDSLKIQEKKKQIELIARVSIIVTRLSLMKAGISISPGNIASLAAMPIAAVKASSRETLKAR